jgi:hypothetical protein
MIDPDDSYEREAICCPKPSTETLFYFKGVRLVSGQQFCNIFKAKYHIRIYSGNTAGNRQKQNSRFCKEIREDNDDSYEREAICCPKPSTDGTLLLC